MTEKDKLILSSKSRIEQIELIISSSLKSIKKHVEVLKWDLSKLEKSFDSSIKSIKDPIETLRSNLLLLEKTLEGKNNERK